MSLIQKKNHLHQETSPYLQQHVLNPVDWYPWSSESLEKARRENKPILLSIGYAACHWCHVMAHESFEDPETAKLMNQRFINIKVDREERPDLDKIYQTSHQLLTQASGGWPLTIFLTPDDLTPFFSGTYFPREARYHLPAFKDVLKSIANIFQNQQADIKKQNAELTKILNAENKTVFAEELNRDVIQQAIQVYQKAFDPMHGGFGGAPKFPQAARLEFLLRNKASLAIGTLQQMADGGIYDQLAGGFYRYTVDAEWRIPHFEKMLYDNAQLLYLYALAAKQFDVTAFRVIAHDTAQWLVDNMQSAEGGYYSSFDADSEGHEGKYYVWDKAEIKKILDEKEYAVFELHYGLNLPANFEGSWHFYIAQPLELVAATLKMADAEIVELLVSAKEKLLAIRKQRISPFCDKKILTAWNALMIKAMLTAGEILRAPALIASAEKSLELIQQKLWVNKRLLASYHEDKAHLPAYLDDYAYLLEALLTRLQISWDTDYLLFAIDLAEILLKNFFDEGHGGFYFTANDHEKLLYRPKTTMDEAIPAGSAVATRALLTLGHLLGETRYLSAAEKTLFNVWNMLQQYPAEHPSFLLVLEDFLTPPQMIILRGTENEMKLWKSAVATNSLVFSIPEVAAELPGELMLRKSQGEICAYICQGVQCKAVITDFHEFKETAAGFF